MSAAPETVTHSQPGAAPSMLVIIGVTAFLTLVDLFATQAILPPLAQRYEATPAAMGSAANASTLGMATAWLAAALFGRHLDRRLAVTASLAILAIPTALLATAPDLLTFAALRFWQGLCMSTAFTLTLAYLGEHCSATAASGAFAAYITGNVASNLLGRLLAAGLVNYFGVAANFHVFAALNLAGAALVFIKLTGVPSPKTAMTDSPLAAIRRCFANPAMRTASAIGFCILFVFIGVFSYVNFVLVRAPLNLSVMGGGFAYLIFLPSFLMTSLAGAAARRLGARTAMWTALGAAFLGLPLMLAVSLPALLLGMTLVACGTFFAQAVATTFLTAAATRHNAAASGLYLASSLLGGMFGGAALGALFDRFGWGVCVAGAAAGLALASALAVGMRTPRR